MLRKVARQIKNLISKAKDSSNNLYYGDLGAYRDLLNDEYVEHLAFVVGGFLVRGNLQAFECCIRNMPPNGAIIEIGSFLGLSTNLIVYATIKYKRDNPFFTCDPWVFAGADKPKSGYFSTGSQEYRDWVMQLFKMNTSLFSKGREPYTIEAFSDRFFELWTSNATAVDVWGRQVRLGGPISFSYIDGAHTYDEVKADFVNVDRHLLPGGFILFDDSSDSDIYEDVKRVVAEVKTHPSYELVLKVPNYCFRKK
jgi:hypothetical protein